MKKFLLIFLVGITSFVNGFAKNQPNHLATSYAVDANGVLWAIMLNEVGRLQLDKSQDFGKTWRTHRTFDSQDKISAHGENRPKLVFGPKNEFIITYTKPLSRPFTGEIRFIRSEDGQTFSDPVTLHDDRQEITHRFESVAFDKQGNLHVVWIDKRDQENIRKLTGKKDAYSGAAIYRKMSIDAGKSFGPDEKLADHSCECCRIALISTNHGVAAMWRHVFEGSIRDHAFLSWSYNSKHTKIVRSTYDNWKLEVCPHHGPALAVNNQGGFHAIWFGEKSGKFAVRYGKLSEHGDPIGQVLDLPDTRAEHADIISKDNTIVVAWRSFDGDKTTIRSMISRDNGNSFHQAVSASTHQENDYPKLIEIGGRFYLLWRTESKINSYEIR